MRNILLAIIVALLPAPIGAGPVRQSEGGSRRIRPGKLLPVKRAHAGNSCAAYGPGFVKVEGTETCVKIGGAVSIGVGGSSATLSGDRGQARCDSISSFPS